MMKLILGQKKIYIGEETNHGDQWNSIRVNQLKNGKIILICDRIARFEKSAETKFYTFESTDDGNSWSFVSIVADSKLGYNGFVAFSEDRGYSYQNLQQIPVKGMHRPFVGYLTDCNIFLSYREHAGGMHFHRS